MNRPFLLFQLYGPLASWGDIAVGEVRPSYDRPSKSAIIGMIAAALGYRRPKRDNADLEAKHRALAKGIRVAIRLDAGGVYLQDYHTVQVPPSTEPWVKTRRDELTQFDYLIHSKNKTNAATAIESFRDYYADMFAIVCISKHSDAGPSLSDIAENLKEPRFTLYLGRKSCPPALPLDPFINEMAASAKEALDRAAVRYRERINTLNERLEEPLFSTQSIRYFWEGEEYEGFEHGPDMEVERWDEPVNRSRWQFRPRKEYIHTEKRHEPL